MPTEKELSPSFTDYVAGLFDDPFRAETARRGRWLVGLSTSLLLVVHFNASLLQDKGFIVSFHDPKTVRSALAFIVFLLLGEFLLRAFMDCYREREHQLLVAKYIAAQTLERKARDAKKVDDQVDAAAHDEEESPSAPDEWWESYFAESERADLRLERLDRMLGSRAVPVRLREVRIWFEITVPTVLSVLAIAAWAIH